MASWYSNILTKTTSQISNLRTTLLSSEADGDTEDDTHVCRVLRDYYTEKGRPFPTWLPPDPKAPPPTQPLYSQPSGSQVGARYGGMGQAGGAGGQPSGLSSLWGDSGGQQQQQQAPQSLRAGRGPAPGPMQQRGGRDDVMARPLPSQRLGSYQTQGAAQSSAPPPSAGGSSAQDRLRQRFRGGGSSRGSSPSQGGQSPFQPPAGAGGYDGSGGGGGGNDNPYVSANAPWSVGDDPYAGGGGGGGGGGYQRPPPPGAGRRQGLPSGPRGYR